MFARIRRTVPAPARAVLILAILAGTPALVASQIAGPAQAGSQPVPGRQQTEFMVKRSDVVLPTDVPMGQYRRVTQPFVNWTLICDENLAKKQKVCNISQTIVDSSGAAVFSWSLAGSQDGKPFFILRIPGAVGLQGSIVMRLSDTGKDVPVAIEGCDGKVCIGYQQVGPRLRAAVKKGGVVGISYKGNSLQEVTFSVPLAGLNEALGAI
ncbi:invasion associated locus B family protein [Brucella gallinifaecis]|uniref:Invasion associated locus B family protein n=1 Tax=Brucella gallinifaecis TaxID=215590 RepID=A0A502BK09_9HYPH|nr:invasion associated locus B family protein [Brucella gallinifaecis]TPF74394.1 Invasion associated locus B family protein [Brucella gallinifaecis]